MQIAQFNEMARAGGINSVVVLSGKSGYSIQVETGDSIEPVRTARGHVRVFTAWSTIKSKLDIAGVTEFMVISKA